jgi:hypothetical protein
MPQIDQAASERDVLEPRARGVVLTEPVEWKLWKSPRRRDIAVVVAVGPYKEHTLFSVREHVIGSDGTMRPSTRGVAMVVSRLPELAKAINKALAKAKELGLLPPDGEG